MSLEENKKALQRLINEAWNNGNLQAVEELVSQKFSYKDTLGNEFKGIDGYSRMVSNWRKAFPDCHYAHDLIIGEGDWISVIVSFTGTFTGELAKFQPNGKSVSWRTSGYYRWINGKLEEFIQFADYLNAYRQLGIIPLYM
ncbi:MAG: ester cyclase [Dehalococcoidales bacterium]|nr:MAG: ester cyclase [Dehalococcoidales bacterium]